MYFIFHSFLLHWFSRMVTCYLHRDKGLEGRICGNHTYTHRDTYTHISIFTCENNCTYVHIIRGEYEE